MSEIEKYYNGEIHVDFEDKTKENNFGKAVEFIVKSDFNKDLNKCLDIVKKLDKKDKVINGMIENEEKYLLEINKLKSIIKEVREYIEKNSLYEQDYDYDYEENLYEYPPNDEQARKDILEILDKGE